MKKITNLIKDLLKPFKPVDGLETVIKGGVQEITPDPPPDPTGGNWGTATPFKN